MISLKSNLIILFATLAIAAYLRLGNLGVSSFWVDELDFVYAAKSEIETGEPYLNSGYTYPRSKLFTWSIIASFKRFGISEFSSRLPSAIFGIMSVWLVYVVGKGLFNPRVGWLSALFLALSPFAIGWSRTCRMYALFQLLFLAGAYLLYKGFESEVVQSTASRDALGISKGFIARLKTWQQPGQLNFWFLLAGAVVMYLSFTTHELAGLFALSFFLYLLVIGLAMLAAKGMAPSAKYLATFSVMAILSLLAFATLSPLQDKVKEGLEFLPKWAEVAGAQNKLRLLDFIFSEELVPLNGFFVIGAAQAFLNAQKAGVYLLSLLAAPMALFTFVFAFQKSSYIFHVYPVIVLLAAYALDRLIQHESASALNSSMSAWLGKIRLQKIQSAIPALLFLAWMPFTFWFRLAMSTPRQADGLYNGAVYHAEWRQAAEHVRQRLQNDDVVISTLPQTVQYYLGRAEYNLNWPNADLAKKKNIVSKDGRLIDYYSGADVIDDLPELERIMAAYAQGWLIVDTYRFGESVYVPREIRQFVEQKLTREFETRRKTMIVFSWKRTPVAL